MSANGQQSECIHKLFEQIAYKYPDKTAIIAQDREFSYTQLNNAADKIAVEIIGKNIQRGSIVAIAMPRCIEMVVCMLAVLKCGAAYLPLDLQNPSSRNRSFLDEAGVGLIVTNQKLCADLNDNYEVMDVTESVVVTAADCKSQQLDSELTGPEDKAYIMYTSGSTGGPKGVIVPHRAIHRLVQKMNYISIEPEDRILHVSPPEFDASTFEVWGALLNAAAVVLYPQGGIDPNLFRKIIKQKKVTVVFITSALFHLLASRFPMAFQGIRAVLTGGDVVSPVAINSLFDHLPGITIISCYGPTENTTFSTSYMMTSQNRPGSIVPIGKPINGTSVHVLNEARVPVAPGEIGELYTSGQGVALGYVNKAKNVDAFIFDKAISQGLIYRTGDMVRLGECGNLKFVGRKDNQVKIRGYRMSLEEVQAALLELDEILDAKVTKSTEPDGEKYLIAHVTLQPEVNLNAKGIKARLADIIPAYMIPDVVSVTDNFAINKNGKIDKTKLTQVPV